MYLDFAKAYDTVDHGILIRKLKNLGITGKVGNWIQTFLTNRIQVTYVDGAASNIEIVLSGIPQGSVLGSMLFLIMINDINTNIASPLVSFADTRIFRGIKGQEDLITLQEDLNKIYTWTV